MVEVYDIETLYSMYSYIGLDINSKQLSKFIICKYQNDLIPLINHLKQVKRHIGYNNLAFDGQVIEYIFRNYKDWLKLDGHKVAGIIYKYAQYCIENSNNGGWGDYPEWKLTIPQLDLFKVWHFDNKAKMTSLKWIEYSIDFHNIEEMYIDHWIEDITWEEVQGVLGYNENDVRATYEFYLITIGRTELPLYKGIDRLELRRNIKKEFKIPCINYNDVKIGDELNKLGYIQRSSRDKKNLKPTDSKLDFTFGDCLPDYISFKTNKFNNFLNLIKPVKIKLDKSKDDKQVFPFEYNGTMYTIMKGGIHSVDKPRIIIPNNNELLIDADIGSQYPNAIRKRKLFPPHLGVEWLDQYSDTIKRRLNAKKLYKQTKEPKYQAIQEAYKLALNGGGYGKLGESTSWQYDPFSVMCTTVGNQFEILMLIESLELEGIHVITANTDGITSIFKKDQEELYYKICKKWELIVGNEDLGQLEYVYYSKLIQTSVNDYIAIKIDGELKPKGDFVTDFELHKNKSAKIIPIALQAYYSKGTEPEETIMNHSNIFDFCLGVKSKGDNKLVHLNSKTGEEIKLQKVNRYYISTNGNNLLKRLKPLSNKSISNQLDIFGNIDDGTREQEVEANWLSTIYNKHINKQISEYQIDYSFYLKKVKKIINNIK